MISEDARVNHMIMMICWGQEELGEKETFVIQPTRMQLHDHHHIIHVLAKGLA